MQTDERDADAISEPDAMVVKTFDPSLNTFTIGSGVLTCDPADLQSSHWWTGVKSLLSIYIWSRCYKESNCMCDDSVNQLRQEKNICMRSACIQKHLRVR